MAASAKPKDFRLAHSFRTRLESLGCPYTDGVDESWITELIFKPGEPRIRLLQWLFSKFDSKLNDVLDPSQASSDSRLDSRIQRLLYVASSLGLCRYDDVDLIRGVTSVGKQSSFMDTLIDLVYIMDMSDDPTKRAMASPGMVSNALPIDEQFTSDSWLMDSIASRENMDAIFATKANLLPPDLTKQIQKSWKDKGHKDLENPPGPDVSQLVDLAKQLEKDLSYQNEILAELKAHHDLPVRDEAAHAKVTKTLRLVLSELSQLIVGFSYCFENEMRQWCNKTPPNLTELGPAFRRVHTLLQQFTALLQGLSNIHTSYTNVMNYSKNQLQDILRHDPSQGLVNISQIAVQSFQECISVLDESTTTRNRTMNSSSMRHSIRLPKQMY